MSADKEYENLGDSYTEINLKDSFEEPVMPDTSVLPDNNADMGALLDEAVNAVPDFAGTPFEAPLVKEDKPKRGLKLSYLQIAGIVLSVMWTLMALQYIFNTSWWGARYSVSPAEFIGVFTGTLLPLMLIWLFISYFERTSALKGQVQLLEDYMSKLVAPVDSDNGTIYTEALTKSLREQVVELKNTFQVVSSASKDISAELKIRIAELKVLASKVDGEIVFSVKDLADNVGHLMETANIAAVRAKEASNTLSDQIITLNTTSEAAAERVVSYAGDIADNVGKIAVASKQLEEQKDEMSSTLKQNTALLNATSESIKERIEDSINTIEAKINAIRQAADGIIDDAAAMAGRLAEKTEALAGVFDMQGGVLDNKVDEVKARADNLVNAFKEKGVEIGEECDRISVRLKSVGDEIALRSEDTFGIVDRSVGKIGSVAEILSKNSEFVSLISEKACADMENSAEMMAASLRKVENSLNSLAERTAEVTDASAARCKDIISISDTVCEKISAVSDSAVSHTKALDSSISGMSVAFAELLAVVKLESEKLSDLSALVVSQSRMAETSLIEQQRHISNSAARIEELKGELKAEIEDLTKAVAIVDESSAASIARMKENMTGLMGLTDEVISRTQEVSTAISQGTENLDKSSGAALNTVAKIAGTLKQEGDNLALLGNRLESQTEALSSKEQTLQEGAAALAKMIAKTEDFVLDKSTKMLENTEAIGNVLAKQADKLDGDLKGIADRVSVIEEAFKMEFASLSASYDGITAKITKISDAIKQSSDAFSGSVDNASLAAGDIVGMFKEVITQIDNLTANSITEVNKLAEKMRITLGEINNNTSASAGEVLSAGEAFIKRAELITNASQAAADKIKLLMSELK